MEQAAIVIRRIAGRARHRRNGKAPAEIILDVADTLEEAVHRGPKPYAQPRGQRLRS
jgi:hypothetical protein